MSVGRGGESEKRIRLIGISSKINYCKGNYVERCQIFEDGSSRCQGNILFSSLLFSSLLFLLI